MQGHTSSYVITTLVTPPASTNLTTLDAIKLELAVPDNDSTNDAWFSTRAIPQASADIVRYCNRSFGQATWQDVFRPQRGVRGEGIRPPNNPLLLTRYPVTADIVTFTGNTHSSNKVDGLSIAITQQLTQGALISGPGIVAGTTIDLVAGTYLLLSQATTATASGVKLSTGIGVVESIAGVDTGLTAGTDFELEQGSPSTGDEGAGCLYRLNQQSNPRGWPAAKVTVVYRAGYILPGNEGSNLPADVEECCIRLVTARFRAKGRDPMLVERSQQGVGTERYWVGGSPGQRGALPPDIEALASNYRIPVIG